jgi:MGT family glycosyltransferase
MYSPSQRKNFNIMTKYVFLNLPAYGHVNPTLAVVQELVSRGHTVSYYITEEFRAVIEATGAVFQPYEMRGMGGSRMFSPGEAMSTPPEKMPDMKEIAAIPPTILERVRADQPDVILYDSMCFWGSKVAEELHVPAITTYASFASNKKFNMMRQMRAANKNGPGAFGMAAQMAKMGPSGLKAMNELSKLFSHFEKFNIVFIPKDFQPEKESFDESYLFVGPSILPRHDAPDFPFEQLNSDLPLLYISLGSVFTNQSEFYKKCFEAFGDQPWQVVLSIGKNADPTTLGPIPKNFLLAGYVPQLDLLPHTSLFVTHGGANSLMESIYFGVPMVLIPQQPEQHTNAEQATKLGIGILLEKEDVSAQSLREAVERVAHDASYHEKVQKMRQSIRTEGGYKRAVDGILEYTKEQAKK